MRLLFLPFTPRYITFTAAVLGTIALATLVYWDPDLGRYVHALLAVSHFWSSLACTIFCKRSIRFCVTTQLLRTFASC